MVVLDEDLIEGSSAEKRSEFGISAGTNPDSTQPEESQEVEEVAENLHLPGGFS